MSTGQFYKGGFRVDHGKRESHADALKLGLKRLGPDFYAHICACGGTGYSKVHYWDCEWCSGTGLCQGNGWKNAAPTSVLNQVLVAAERGAA